MTPAEKVKAEKTCPPCPSVEPPRPEDRGRVGDALGVASLICSLAGSVLLGLAVDQRPVLNGLGGKLGPTAQNVFGELFSYLPSAGTALLMAGFTAGLADRRTWRGRVGLALSMTAGCLAAFFLCGVSGSLLLAAYLLFMAYGLANISLAGLHRAGSRRTSSSGRSSGAARGTPLACQLLLLQRLKAAQGQVWMPDQTPGWPTA